MRSALALAAFALAALAALACSSPPPAPRAGQAPGYAGSAWATLHRDSRNSDFAPLFATGDLRVLWSSLEGATMWVGPTLGADGHVYATSGRGVGTAHLHAFDRDGNLVWESAPMQSLADLDYGAVINAPLVGDDGSVYQADLDQLWAFASDGRVRWVASLRDAGAQGHFVTPIFSKEGHVGGITTDGVLLLFARDDGRLAMPAFALPGVGGPPAIPAPEGLVAGGLHAPEFIQPMWNLIFGREVEVANTPAVHPTSGRIFVTAGGATPGSGALYGIDAAPEGAVIAFAFEMAQGSGTSPAISPDGALVYAAGDDGVMVALDAATGALAWRAEDTAAAASPTIGGDGTVYSTTKEQALVALDGRSGERRFEVGFGALAEEWLAESPERGPRVASVNSIVTATHDAVFAVVDLGYRMTLGDRDFAQPHRFALVAVDPQDGRRLAATELPGSSSAIVVPDVDGRVYVSLVAASTSMAWYGVNPMLPEELRAPGPPVAGLVALAPREPGTFLRDAVDATRESLARAAREEASSPAFVALVDAARAQLAGLGRATTDAAAEDALAGDAVSFALDRIDAASGTLGESLAAARDADASLARRKLAAARAELIALAAALAGP